MAAQDFLVGAIETLLDVFRPLEQSLVTTDAFSVLLMKYGWAPPTDLSYLPTIQTALSLATEIETLAVQVAHFRATEVSLEDVQKTVQDAVALIAKIRNLATQPAPSSLPSPLNSSAFWQSFPLELVDGLFADYLEILHPSLFAPLHLFGIIDESFVRAGSLPGRVDYVRTEFKWDRLRTLLTNPLVLIQQVYGWGSTLDAVGPDGDTGYDRLLRRLERAFLAFGIPAGRRLTHHGLLSEYYDSDNPALKMLRELQAPFLVDEFIDTGYIELGLVVLPIPPKGQKGSPPSGFLVGPFVVGHVAEEIPVGGPFLLQLKGGLASDSPVGIEVRPDGVGAHLASAATVLDLSLAVVATPSSPWILVGSAGSHRVQISDATVGVSLQGPVSDPELALTLGTGKVQVVLDFSEGDGFLNKVLGTDPQTFETQGTAVWSSKKGLALSGSAGLAINLPINATVGTAEIDSIALKIAASSARIGVVAAVTGHAKLGPVTATVEEIGIKLGLTPQSGGTFGDLDVGFGFKFPTGLGILIDAGAIVGGGFISFDPDSGRYAGALELKVLEVTVKAIAVLDTRLPGGVSGFSFYIGITAEGFTPIQLGFGFTLNGVGGLAGINRTMMLDALQAAVKTHSLDSILFPKNIIANAPQIISEIRTIFPPAEGRYAFGPMAEIGWGTPTLIYAELGMVLELPSPVRLAILGIIHAVVPDETDAVLVLNIDIVGTIDFGKKSLAIDSTIYDSRLLVYSLLGDMALRFLWGDNPTFVLAVGGLNPQFKAIPPGFPTLHRITLSLGSGNNPRFNCTSYTAATSNTIQFGSQFELYASAAGFDIHGYLGFDVLVVPLPFSFIADMQGGLDVQLEGQTLLGMTVSVELRGTTPWHLHATATLNLTFFSISGTIDQSWGSGTPQSLPSAPVLKPLGDALSNAQNWTAQLPDGAERAVSLLGGKPDDGRILVHPIGLLSVRQTVVPLKTPITKFGNTIPTDGGRFDIGAVSLNGAVQTFQDVPEPFARAQYQDMSDADKLAAPAYEPLPAGVSIGSGAVLSGHKADLDLRYETLIMDDPLLPSRHDTLYAPPLAVQIALARQSAGELSPIRRTGLGKFIPPGTKSPITIRTPRWVVASTDDLSIREDLSEGTGTTQWVASMNLKLHLAEHPEDAGRYQVMAAHEAVS